MASLKCSECGAKIQHNSNACDVRYVYFTKADWEEIASCKFDAQNKKVAQDGTVYLYKSDTIEIEFSDKCKVFWKCPKCNSFVEFERDNVTVKKTYKTQKSENEKFDYDGIMFSDYVWEEITEAQLPVSRIMQQYKPTYLAKIEEDVIVVKIF